LATTCLELLQKTLFLAKDNLTKVEVSELLLATDNKGRTVFHVAAPFSEIFQRILNLAKENLTKEEVTKLSLDSHKK
jgi:hypothetical protein